MKILPTITTITNWRKKIKESKELGLTEVALFPTSLSLKEREELYQLLKKTKIRRIPFVHLRSDMVIGELDYLVKNYKTGVFNIHSSLESKFAGNIQKYHKYKKILYIENTSKPLDKEELKKVAGICLDSTHLENDRIFRKEIYRHNIKIIKKLGCGCNHIGPVKKFPSFEKEEIVSMDNHHFFKKLSEFNYLKKYPANFFGEYAALELENSIREQLEAKNYIIKLLMI